MFLFCVKRINQIPNQMLRQLKASLGDFGQLKATLRSQSRPCVETKE